MPVILRKKEADRLLAANLLLWGFLPPPLGLSKKARERLMSNEEEPPRPETAWDEGPRVPIETTRDAADMATYNVWPINAGFIPVPRSKGQRERGRQKVLERARKRSAGGGSK